MIKKMLKKYFPFLRKIVARMQIWRLPKSQRVMLIQLAEQLSLSPVELVRWQKLYQKTKNILHSPAIEVAQLLTNSAYHENANQVYEQLLKENFDKTVYSLYLQNLLLSSSATNESLLSIQKRWNEYYHSVSRLEGEFSLANRKQRQTKIRIGYICHFFANSISQNVFLPFLKNHDRNRFEIYCYDDGETPAELKSLADYWRDIRGWSDLEVAKQIKTDEVDILQEMNGFCFINRFGALAYRPAPIQINWYNHNATTGLNYIDYVMTDRVSIEENDRQYYVEECYRSEEFIAAVEFDQEKFGEITKVLPVNKNKHITFGYFGASHKITYEAIKLWADVLRAVPDATLILKGASFSHEIYVKNFTHHFVNIQKIDPARIKFIGWTDQADTLRWYNSIDIMLDCIPTTGGSTFFEALLQGVPPITLRGQRWAGRSGASVLTTLGHPELIAETSEQYIEIAKKLSHDLERLMVYRQTLRAEMLNSSLTNIKSFYNKFEKAYLYMFEKYQQKITESESEHAT